jgi:dipeptidyl-peptidase-4
MRTLILTPMLAVLLSAVAAPGEGPTAVKDAPVNPEYLRQHAATRGFLLGRPVKPKFTPDNQSVLFLRSEARAARMRLYEFDVATGKTKELLTPETVLKGAEENLSAEEKTRRERQRISVGGFSDYQLSEDGKLILLPLSGKLYLYQRDNGKVRELATGKGTLLDPKFSPDGSKVAYVLDHDVYVYDLATDKETAVTKGGTAKKPHGLAEFVAQEEMHRHSGYWWSPDGKHIAYQETDHDGVEVWYVADPTKPEQPPEAQYYPRPGKKNAAVRLGIIPIGGGETVWVPWDRSVWEYLALVRWDKEGPLTIVLQDRKQQWMAWLTVDPATGKTKELTSQHSDTWINIDPTLPRWLPDGSVLLPGAEGVPEVRDGAGERAALLPPGWTHFRRLVSLNPKTREAIYLGGEIHHASQQHVFSLTLPRPGQPRQTYLAPKRLSGEPGQYDAVCSRDHSLYALTATTPSSLPRTTVHKADGTLLGELPSVAEEPPFRPRLEFVNDLWIDARPTDAIIIRPRNFDPKKKYPVLIDVYGGPGHQHVVSAMRNWLLPQWLADQGFIVVALENRGTPGRDDRWEKALYRQFGSVPLNDQVEVLRNLYRRYPEMDAERVGIVGWSFGGYMSALAVLRRPDVFKAAVAGAPVTDWEDYDTHYTERYMGLLPENRKDYDDSSLLPLASKLERPLLLVHGTADDNVYFRHTLRLTDALFRAGKDFEVLPLPSLTHMVPDPVVTERLWTREARFFKKHLGEPVPR